jgi:hypothetical protein
MPDGRAFTKAVHNTDGGELEYIVVVVFNSLCNVDKS